MNEPISYEKCAELVARLQQVTILPPQEQDLRFRIHEAARRVTRMLEPPLETVQRIAYAPLELVAARIAHDLGLFVVLARLGGLPLKLDYLSRLCHADERLLARILRFCASHDMVEEVEPGSWRANGATRALATPEARIGIKHNHDVVAPCWLKLSQFLQKTGNKNPTSPECCAFHLAHATALTQLSYLGEVNLLSDYYSWAVVNRGESDLNFLDVFDFQCAYRWPCDPQRILFVHVAATTGSQCNALKRQHPTVKGHIVLQSFDHMLPQIQTEAGIIKWAHDIRNPQPIIGARFYYFRHVGSNFREEEFAGLLKRTMEAMDKHSVILIDDIVIQDKGAHWIATQIDMAAMAFTATQERSRQEWEVFLHTIGLCILQVGVYHREKREAVIVAAPVGREHENGDNADSS